MRWHLESIPEQQGANQDAADAVTHPQDDKVILACIADGVGGIAGGQKAAADACAHAMRLLREKDAGEWVLPSRLCSVLHEVDRLIHDDPDAGQTTLAVMALSPAWVCGASVGDSDVALIGPDRSLVHLTTDQDAHPHVGSGKAPPTPFSSNVLATSELLMMTDGVWKYAGWSQIAEHARRYEGRKLMQAIAASAQLERTGAFHDDYTYIWFGSSWE